MTSPRSLALLAGLASPIFLAAAVFGWLSGFWPANPITLGIAAVTVIAGPLVGMFHVATADRDDYSDEPVEITVAAATAKITPDPLVTPRAASARAFHNWRDSSTTLRALPCHRPIDLMCRATPSTPSRTIASGVAASLYNVSVARFTDTSVACADSTTATNSV